MGLGLFINGAPLAIRPSCIFLTMQAQSGRIRRNGFSVLSSGEDSEGGSPIVDIVFVHGLGGHPEKTWSTEAAKPAGNTGIWSYFSTRQRTESSSVPEKKVIFWPKDLLPQNIKNARIMTYGYDADPVKVWGVNRVNILRHSEDLLIALAAQRRDNPERPLVFIAHSLGGILVKDAIKQSKDAKYKTDLQPTYKATYGIVFMGVPHRGSNWVTLAKNMSALALGSADMQVVRALDVNSETLERLMTDFANLLANDSFKIHTFQETQDMVDIPGLRGKIVEPFSSVIGDAREPVQELIGNHVSMCKFDGAENDNYQKVCSVLDGYMLAIKKKVAGVQSSSGPEAEVTALLC